jgi:hypothetical protein
MNKILTLTVRGHNLQKDYNICRQTLLGWGRNAEGVLCKLLSDRFTKKIKYSAVHVLEKSFRMMYSIT